MAKDSYLYGRSGNRPAPMMSGSRNVNQNNYGKKSDTRGFIDAKNAVDEFVESKEEMLRNVIDSTTTYLAKKNKEGSYDVNKTYDEIKTLLKNIPTEDQVTILLGIVAKLTVTL